MQTEGPQRGLSPGISSLPFGSRLTRSTFTAANAMIGMSAVVSNAQVIAVVCFFITPPGSTDNPSGHQQKQAAGARSSRLHCSPTSLSLVIKNTTIFFKIPPNPGNQTIRRLGSIMVKVGYWFETTTCSNKWPSVCYYYAIAKYL